MKKVIEKLNRVLSILLVAALVVGSVPEMGLVAKAAPASIVLRGTLKDANGDEVVTMPEGGLSSESDYSFTVKDGYTATVTAADASGDPVEGFEATANGDTYTIAKEDVVDGYTFTVNVAEKANGSEESKDEKTGTPEDDKTNEPGDGDEANSGENGGDGGEPSAHGANADSKIVFGDASAYYDAICADLKNISGSTTMAPERDEFTILAPEKVNETTYKITGSLPYIDGFTAFDKDNEANQSGYYILVVIEKPDGVTGHESENMYGYGIASSEGKGITLSAGASKEVDGAWPLLLHIPPNAEVTAEKKITYIAVDWDGNDVADEYAQTVYTLDWTGVKLERRKSEIIFGDAAAKYDAICADLKSVSGAETKAPNKDEFKILTPRYTGNNTYKLEGSLPYIEGFTAFDNSDINYQNGYYMLMLIEKPEGIDGVNDSMYGFDGTVDESVNLEYGKSDELDGAWPLMLHVNESKTVPDRKTEIAIDWDGAGGKYEKTIYTLDWNGVTLEEKKSEIKLGDATAKYTQLKDYLKGSTTKKMPSLSELSIITPKYVGDNTYKFEGKLPYIEEFEAFSGNTDEQKGHYLVYVLERPQGIAPSDADVVFGWGSTATQQEDVAFGNDDFMVVCERLEKWTHTGGIETFTVDWDGAEGHYAPTTYTLDWSDVVLEPKASESQHSVTINLEGYEAGGTVLMSDTTGKRLLTKGVTREYEVSGSVVGIEITKDERYSVKVNGIAGVPGNKGGGTGNVLTWANVATGNEIVITSEPVTHFVDVKTAIDYAIVNNVGGGGLADVQGLAYINTNEKIEGILKNSYLVVRIPRGATLNATNLDDGNGTVTDKKYKYYWEKIINDSTLITSVSGGVKNTLRMDVRDGVKVSYGVIETTVVSATGLAGEEYAESWSGVDAVDGQYFVLRIDKEEDAEAYAVETSVVEGTAAETASIISDRDSTEVDYEYWGVAATDVTASANHDVRVRRKIHTVKVSNADLVDAEVEVNGVSSASTSVTGESSNKQWAGYKKGDKITVKVTGKTNKEVTKVEKIEGSGVGTIKETLGTGAGTYSFLMGKENVTIKITTASQYSFSTLPTIPSGASGTIEWATSSTATSWKRLETSDKFVHGVVYYAKIALDKPITSVKGTGDLTEVEEVLPGIWSFKATGETLTMTINATVGTAATDVDAAVNVVGTDNVAISYGFGTPAATNVTDWKLLKSGINTISISGAAGSQLWVKVVPADHYELKNESVVLTPNDSNGAPISAIKHDGGSKNAITGINVNTYAGKGLKIEVNATKIKNTYNIVGSDDAVIKVKTWNNYVEVSDDDGNPRTIEVDDGDKIYVSAMAKKETQVASVVATKGTGATLPVTISNSDDAEYQKVIISNVKHKNSTNYATIKANVVDKANIKTLKFTMATGVNQVYTNVDSSTKLANGEPGTDDVATAGIAALPGQRIKFKLASTTGNYVPDKVYYTVGGKVKEIPGSDGLYELRIDDDFGGTTAAVSVNVKVTEKINPAKIRTASFNYPTEFVNVWKGATASTYSEADDVTLHPEKAETLDKLQLVAKAKAGYAITSISVGGEDVSVSGDGKGNQTITVNFDDNNRTKAVDITAAPLDNTKARKFTITAADGVEVTADLGGGVSYSSRTKTYTVSNGTNTVGLTAKVNYGYKVKNSNGTRVNELYKNDSDGKTVVYKYEVVANLLAGGSVDALIFGRDDDYVTMSIVPDKGLKYGVDGKEMTATYSDNKVRKGTQIRITPGKDQKLEERAANDELGNQVWTELGTDSYGDYTFTISGNTDFRIKSTLTKPDYVAKVVKNGNTEPKNAVGTTTEVSAVKEDEIVVTVAGEDSPSNTLALAEVAVEEGIKSKIDLLDNDKQVKVTVAKDDAGKSIVLNLKDRTTKKLLTTVTINVSAYASGIIVTDGYGKTVADGSEVTVDLTTGGEFTVDTVPAGVDSSMYRLARTPAGTKFENGKLTYTPSKEGTEEFKIVDSENSKKELFKFTVKTVSPALGLAGFDSTLQSDTYVNIAASAGADVNYNKNLFYEIVSKPADGAGRPAKAVKRVKYVSAVNDTDKKVIPLAIEQFRVIKGEDDKLTSAEKEAIAWTYDLSVRLVVIKEASVGTVDTTVYRDSEVTGTAIVAAGDAMTRTRSTKNPYIADSFKLKKGKTTLLNGETAVVATIQYDAKASTVKDAAVNVLNKDGSYNSGFERSIDFARGEVLVTPGETVKAGEYIVRVYPSSMSSNVKSKAEEIKIKVVAGTTAFDLSAIPARITKNNSQDTKIDLSTVCLTGVTDSKGNKVKAKSQKVSYDIVRADSQHTALGTGARDLNIRQNVSISKGKLIVSKEFAVGKNREYNIFALKITALDNGEDGHTEYRDIEVTEDAVVPARIVLKDAAGNTLGSTIDYAAASKAKVVVEDAKGNRVNDFVKITPASGSAYVKDGNLVINGKPSRVTIKAASTDGGKNSAPALTVKLTYATASKGIDLKVLNDTVVKVTDSEYKYASSDKTIPLNIAVYNGSAEDEANRINPNHYKLEVKVNGKTQVISENGMLSIMPDKSETKIVVKDKGVKPNTERTIKLTDTSFTREKAPTAKQVKGSKLYANMAGGQTIDFSVNTAFEAVQVLLAGKEPKGVSAGIEEKVYRIERGVFTVESSRTGEKAGSVKYSFIYGNYSADGRFVPMTKPATLTVKTTKLTKFKPDTSYVLNYIDSDTFEFTGSPSEGLSNILSVQNVVTNGKANKFATYFTKDGWNTIKFNQLAAKETLSGIKAEDMTGYVTYVYNNGSGMVESTVKVTVALSTEHRGYEGEFTPVMKNSGMVTEGNIKLGDDIVSIKEIRSATSRWKVRIKENSDGEVIVLESSSAPVGMNEVSLKIIPADSWYAASAAKEIDSKGIAVTVNVNVLNPAEATNKIKVDETMTTVALDGAQRYGNKVGYYSTNAINLAGSNAGTKYVVTPAVKGVSVRSAKLGAGAPDGFTVDYTSATGVLKIEAQGDKIKAGDAVSVPVSVEFTNSTVPEIVTFTVVTPASFKNLDAVRAEVEEYLRNRCYNANFALLLTTAQGGIDTILSDNAAAGVQRGAVETVQGNPAAGTPHKVKVTLQSKADTQNTAAIEEEVSINAPLVLSKQENFDQVRTDIGYQVSRILNEGTVTENDTRIPGVDYYEVSVSTTKYDLRSFLSKAIVNDGYMIRIVDYIVEAPEVGFKGSIEFKYTIVKPDGSTSTTYKFKRELKALTEE